MSFLLPMSLFASMAVSSPTQSGPSDQTRHQAPMLSVNQTGWEDPRKGGGRMLDYATRCNYGEPLNVIISGNSDPRILDLEGLILYSYSLGYAEECLGLHVGRVHQANLGDGQGLIDEQYLARQTYFPIFGTCWQSIIGGQHFRAWQQNTTQACLFRSCWCSSASLQNSGRNHMIVPNGYNLGRDWLVKRAIAGTSWRGMYWAAEVDWHEGLLEPGRQNINHNISQDGVTAILTVYPL
ncbi:hypothetical protein BU17DRAFT_55307 [Hysterangium stoloniferum]|nr:hypothetical protein BU17DRAFT_55307 [Hysterangium stoloniferum]